MAVFAFRLVFLTVFVAMVVGSGFLDTGDQDRYLEYLLRRNIWGMSGVTVDEGAMSAYTDLTDRKYRWIIFKLSDDTTLTTDVKDSGDHCFDEFLGKLKESGEPRYAVYDVGIKTVTGKNENKKVFIVWTPESVPFKVNLVYKGSAFMFRRALGITSTYLLKSNDASFKEELVQEAGMAVEEHILPELQNDCA